MLQMLLQTPLVLGESTSSALINGDVLMSLVKLLFVLTAGLYTAFSFVVTRQIKVMRTTLITSFSPILSLIGWLHFALAVGVLLIFILFL